MTEKSKRLLDWAKRSPHNCPCASPHGVCKIFVQCSALNRQFSPNVL